MKSIGSILLLVCLCISAGGCRFYSRHQILSVWGDWNTYEQPAFVVDDKNHLPYRGPEVAYFNWMYGSRTYKPIEKKKNGDHFAGCNLFGEGPLTILGIPLLPNSRTETQESPQLLPENIINQKSSPSVEATRPPIPTAKQSFQLYLPMGYQNVTRPEKFDPQPDDESSLNEYPLGNLKTLSGSRPNESAGR
ncbi:MAG: hypothetical protein O2955_11095 [Planctomycetota bacterium]|nr:hypothetical protein [Planctomycetota bacterium]MDA1213059.1 hypothetical protein [Planctomycetota bacterium]